MLNYLGIFYLDLFIYNLLNCFSFFKKKGYCCRFPSFIWDLLKGTSMIKKAFSCGIF
jgi:hypothetical protein